MASVYKDIFAGLIDVCNGQFYLGLDNSENHLSREEFFRWQNNGLCGAAIQGGMLFMANPKVAVIYLKIHLCEIKPRIKAKYTDIVEVSFRASEESIFLLSREEMYSLWLPNNDYRIRYSIVGLDNKYDCEQESEDCFSNPVHGQQYLIEVWPQEKSQGNIIKQASLEAAYWHKKLDSKNLHVAQKS